MNESEIKARMLALGDAYAKGDEGLSAEIGLSIVTQFLVDTNRIATALERMASTTPSKMPWGA
jgi:hypothetical protein